MDLKKLTKPKLIELCKKYNLSLTGNKSDLVDRINLYKDGKKTFVEIDKDENGNFVHAPTGLIFDPNTKRVFRTKDSPFLTRKDIDLCKEYKFLFVLPETLDDNLGYKSPVLSESDDSEDDQSDDDEKDF